MQNGRVELSADLLNFGPLLRFRHTCEFFVFSITMPSSKADSIMLIIEIFR